MIIKKKQANLSNIKELSTMGVAKKGLQRLLKYKPDIVNAMKLKEHSFKYTHLSKLGIIGDSWTHTMICLNDSLRNNLSKEEIAAALFHDTNLNEDEIRLELLNILEKEMVEKAISLIEDYSEFRRQLFTQHSFKNEDKELFKDMGKAFHCFVESRPHIVESMKLSDHNYSFEHLSPFHAEGSVWTHTLMVLNEAIKLNSPKESILAALLHDIGKPPAEEVNDEKQRKRFIGHEGISFFMAADILTNELSHFVNKNEAEMTLKLIACHSELFQWKGGASDDGIKSRFSGNPDFLKKLSYQAISDWGGRIRLSEDGDTPPDLINIANTIKLPNKNLVNKDLPVLTILVGLPAAGKSTYKNNMEVDFVTVCRDDILEEVTEGSSYNDKFNKQDSQKINSILDKTFQNAAKEGKNIVVDMTNMSKKARRKWLKHHWIKKNEYKTEIIVFATGFDLVTERNKTRKGKEIGYGVCKKMAKAFSYPMEDEAAIVKMILPKTLK